MQFPWLQKPQIEKASNHLNKNNLSWVTLILAFCFEIASQLNAQKVSENDSPAKVYQSAMQREKLHNAAIFTLLVGMYCMIALRM